MDLKCRLLNKEDFENWDKFLDSVTPNAFYSLYNSFDWSKVLIRSYGYDPYYLVVKRGNTMVGCFPLMLVKSKLFGNRLISIPFTDHGCGPYAKNNDSDTINFMLEKINKLVHKFDVKYVKINSPQNWVQDVLSKANYQKGSQYFTFVLNLNKSFDNICKSFKKSVRNSYRKSQKNGVKVILGDNYNFAKIFYKIQLDNMKRLGTPPHSQEFYNALWDIFGKKKRLRSYFVEYNGKIVASIILFPYRDSVRWGAGVSLSKYRYLNPMYPLLWDAIKWSTENGYHTFDMGGSRPNSGNFFFKQRWINKDNTNGQIINIQHQYAFFKNKENKVVDLNDSQYQRLSTVWRMLMPKPIATLIGPSIRKQIAA